MMTMLLFVAVAPAVLCGILLLATGALNPANDARLHWSVPLAVAAGSIVAELGGGVVPNFPPVEASDWFIPIAAVIAVMALVRPRLGHGGWSVVRLVLIVAAIGVIVRPLFLGAWTPGQGIAWCVGMAAVIAVTSWSVDHTASVATGWGFPAAVLVIASGAALSVALAGSARYGQAIGAVASALGPVTLLGFLRRDTLLLRGAWAPFLIVASILIASLTFVDVPVFACVSLMAGFFSLRFADLGVVAARPAWREVLRLGIAIICVVIAIGLSLPSDSSGRY